MAVDGSRISISRCRSSSSSSVSLLKIRFSDMHGSPVQFDVRFYNSNNNESLHLFTCLKFMLNASLTTLFGIPLMMTRHDLLVAVVVALS